MLSWSRPCSARGRPSPGACWRTAGVIEVATVTPDTPPVGWGTATRVALARPLGWAVGEYDSVFKRYTIDLTDRQTFPTSPCPVTDYQMLWNGTAMLHLSGEPVGGYDVQVKYPGQNSTPNCALNYTQSVDLRGNLGSCSGTSPPIGGYCP
jgi:hypothetical protein